MNDSDVSIDQGIFAALWKNVRLHSVLRLLYISGDKPNSEVGEDQIVSIAS